jgi:hypothetical protein
MVYACHPRFEGKTKWEDHSLKNSPCKKGWRAWLTRWSSCLASNCKALSLTPSTSKGKSKERKKTLIWFRNLMEALWLDIVEGRGSAGWVGKE